MLIETRFASSTKVTARTVIAKYLLKTSLNKTLRIGGFYYIFIGWKINL